MTSRTRALTLLFGLSALGFSSGAAWVHHKLIVDPTYVPVCDINATFNCAQVYLSRFGTIGGVPVALGGVIWSVLVLLVAGLHRPQAGSADAPADATGAYLFALATVGLASVLYFGYVSWFVIKAYCVLCIGTYISVIAIFIVTGLATTIPLMEIPVRLLRDLRKMTSRPTWLLVALLFLGGSIALVMLFPREAPAATPSRTADAAPAGQDAGFIDLWSKQPRVDLGIPADGAKVIVVKFNDWQCPSCKMAHEAYKPVFEKYAREKPGAVKYVLKDYPLNTKCNFQLPSNFPGHAGACEAAVAVRLARAKGPDKEDALVTWLLGNQETLTPATVKSAAERLAGVTDFDKQYPIVINDVKRDINDGGVLQVGFTPTFYINGVKANTADGRWLPVEYFEMILQYEISKSEKAGK